VNALEKLTPSAPSWRIDWPAIEAALPALAAQRDCPQDPRFRAEGDVWTHTRLACEALTALPAFRRLAATDQAIVFAAVLLHDLGKPATTRREPDGQIASPFHGPRGAVQARALLWRMDVPFSVREQTCALVRFHQAPFHWLDAADSRRRVIEISQTARCNWLSLVAEADVRGRNCADRDELLLRVALFAEYCRELDCYAWPYPFASEHSRFEYFRTDGREPGYAAYDATRCEVVLLSGLPGAGKDRWLRRQCAHLPVVSLDGIRDELGIDPSQPQGRVASMARERARALLRAGEAFVYNGTHLSRPLRRKVIDLFAAYNARVRIVYVEVSPARLSAQNCNRAVPVPERVIERLLARWDVPDLTEAHRVDYVVTD